MLKNNPLLGKLVIGLLITVAFLFSTDPLLAQVPKPSDEFGFEPGADYKLASYSQLLDYYHKLDAASDRVKLVNIGKSTLGRPMILLFISSKQNLQELDRWKDISSKLARARIDSVQAQKLSHEGKAVIWIDAGMHAGELAPAQMAPLLAYHMATGDTPEMQKIRKNVVLLLMPVWNPDGLSMVRNWYYDHLGTPYETSGLPWPWQEYVGHDNNRDEYINNMQETKNISKILYQEWFPQVVYNHHQQGPGWARMFVPPFRSPVNQHIQPGVTAGVNEIGTAMINRFAIKHMSGVISTTGYTMYWDGGMREVPYYHNMLGILTETTHNSPTPSYWDPKNRPKEIDGLLTDSTSIFYPDPWLGGWVHLRTPMDYGFTASMALLNYAADRHVNLLYNIYNMGRHAISEGEAGDPYAYVIPKKQWDGWEAKNLVNVLFRGGVEIKRATSSFAAGGKQYQAGSFIVYTGQAFRPYVMDLLDVQHYPTSYQYPGGPPRFPYDITGWTLPMQMGVSVDRIAQSFQASAKNVTALIDPISGQLHDKGSYGYLLSDKSNVAVKMVNQLLADGANVSRTTSEISHGGQAFLPGSYIIRGANEKTLKKMADTYGVDMYGLSSKPNVDMKEIKLPKVGLFQPWSGNADPGWTRWLLKDQYGFEVDSLHSVDVASRDLSQYQSIILPSLRPSTLLHGNSILRMPKKYTGGLGTNGGVDALKKYVKKGGTLIAFDASSDFVIQQFGLPVRDAVQGLSNEQFFIPGTLIKASIDNQKPLAWGMQDTVATAFEHSRAFSIDKYRRRGFRGGKSKLSNSNVTVPEVPVSVISRYAPEAPNLLMSGWMLGGEHIAGKPAMVQLPYGKGQIIMFAFRPQFRGQPRGTYKLIFNALYGSTMGSYPTGSK